MRGSGPSKYHSTNDGGVGLVSFGFHLNPLRGSSTGHTLQENPDVAEGAQNEKDTQSQQAGDARGETWGHNGHLTRMQGCSLAAPEARLVCFRVDKTPAAAVFTGQATPLGLKNCLFSYVKVCTLRKRGPAVSPTAGTSYSICGLCLSLCGAHGRIQYLT